MGFSQIDPSTFFVDEDPDAEVVNDIFVDYDPDDLQKMQMSDVFSDNDPDALVEKTAKVKSIWDENTPENREARKQVIHDYMYAPEKTPEEISKMSFWEKIEYSKQLDREFKYRQSKGLTKGAASGVSFGLSEYVPGLEPEEDDMLFGFGELIGSAVPITGLYNLLGKPLVKIAAKSPVAKSGLQALARMTGFGLTGGTYEGVKDVVKTGEAPSVEDVALHAASWAALDGVLQAVGKTASFANKLYRVSKNNKNLKKQEIVNDVIQQLSKEKINPEVDPDLYARRAEELLDSKLPKEERRAIDPLTEELVEEVKKPESNSPEIPDNSLVEEAKVEAKPAKLEIEKPAEQKAEKQPKVEQKTPEKEPKPSVQEKKSRKVEKVKPKPQPVHVDIPPEDLGKSASEIVGKHVQTGQPAWKFQLPNTKSLLRVAETKFYNRFAPLKDLEVAGESIMNQPRKLAELVKGYASTAESVLKYGQYDLETGLINGPGFEEIFLPKRLKELTGKKKLDRTLFDQYLASRSSLERQAAGQKNPIPTQAAKALIRENPQYKVLADDLTQFTRNDVQNLRKAGIISKEAEQAMFNAYENYAPLHRVMPEEMTLAEQVREGLTGQKPSDVVPIPGGHSLKASNPIKSAKGSEKMILSPTESIVKNTIATQKAIAKNQTMKSIGRQLEKYGYEAREINPPKRSQKELQRLIGDKHFEVQPEMVEELNDAVNFLNPSIENPKGNIRWYEDGKLMEVKGVPKEITQALESLTPDQSSIVLNTIAKANQMFSAGVVLQPATMVKLGAMDLLVSTLQSKYPKFGGILELPTRLMYEYPRMFLNILKKGDLYKSYMQSGAAQSAIRGLDRPMLESMTDNFTNALKRKNTLLMDTLKLPLKPFKIALDALKKSSEVMSDVPRLLEFERSMKASMKKGLSRPEAMKQAAFDAFEVSVPYGRKGSSQSLNFLYKVPLMGRFMNTIINSGVSVAKALDPRNPVARGVYAGATAYLTIPTVAQYLRNRNDPRYQALPQEDRDRNVYVYRTDDPDEEPLKFRKFWQYGWLFQTLPEHIIEHIIQKDPKAYDGLLESFESEFSPFSSVSFSSAFPDGKFDPSKLYEAGRYSLIPDRQKNIDAELQATSNTSQIARKLAQFTKVSPIYIDFLVNQVGGGLGKDILRLADEAIYQTGLAVDKRPEKQAADSIFYGTFFARGPSKRTEYANKFYEYVDKMETKKNTANALYKEGRDDEAEKILENYVDLSKMRKSIGKYYKRLEEIHQEHPDDLNGVAKRKELNEIYKEMTDLFKEYVEDIEDALKPKK